MAKFKPVMINNDSNLDMTVGAMNVNKATGDITFITSDGAISNKAQGPAYGYATSSQRGLVRISASPANADSINWNDSNCAVSVEMLRVALNKYGANIQAASAVRPTPTPSWWNDSDHSAVYKQMTEDERAYTNCLDDQYWHTERGSGLIAITNNVTNNPWSDSTTHPEWTGSTLYTTSDSEMILFFQIEKYQASGMSAAEALAMATSLTMAAGLFPYIAYVKRGNNRVYLSVKKIIYSLANLNQPLPLPNGSFAFVIAPLGDTPFTPTAGDTICFFDPDGLTSAGNRKKLGEKMEEIAAPTPSGEPS